MNLRATSSIAKYSSYDSMDMAEVVNSASACISTERKTFARAKLIWDPTVQYIAIHEILIFQFTFILHMIPNL